jgi:hypothetical protein
MQMMKLARSRIFAFDCVAAQFRDVEKPLDGQNTIIVSSLHWTAALNDPTHRVDSRVCECSR